MYDLDKLGYQFGERIHALRQNQNLSQMDLAELADLNASYIGHLEHGTKSPTLQTLGKLANALQVTLPDLLTIDTQPEQKKKEIETLLCEYTIRILNIVNDPN